LVYKKLIHFGIITASVVFCFFVLLYETHARRLAQTRMDTHAQVIAENLWNFNLKGVKEYLILASKSENYKVIRITDHEGRIFQEVAATDQKGMDRFLDSLGLIPHVTFTSPVLHKKSIIGKIDAIWYCKTIYIYVYVLFAIGLLIAIFFLYLRLLKAKQELEEKVQERTTELSASNISLQMEIKERARAEQAIRENQEIFNAIDSAARDALIMIDHNGHVTYWSKACKDIFGYSRDEMMGKDLHLVLAPEQFHGAYHKAFTGFRVTGKGAAIGHTLELKARHKNGKELPVELSLSSVRVKNNWHALGIMRDITERKQAEEKLHEERELLSTVLDGNPIPIFMIDQDHHVGFWNRALETLTSIPREQVIGNTLRESLGQVYLDKTPPILADLILDLTDDELSKRYGHKIKKSTFGEAFEVTTNIWGGNEKRILNAIAIRIRDHQGKVVGAIQCAQDLTDREQLQGQLLQVQKMDAIGTLAGGIAHDFNNILSSIIGYTELALDDAKKDTLQSEHLQEILTAGNRATDLVKQILTFSRQEDRKRMPVQIKLIVKEALKLLRASIPTTIEFKQNLPSNALVLGDSTQIHQVIMNLCTNAYHAMENTGGELNVTLTDVEIESGDIKSFPDLEQGKYIKLTVSDTGHGIDPVILKRIFEPYFTTKEKDKGSGMGLSVVHGIVKSHNGHIAASSEPGSGTSFNVYFPILVHDAIEVETISVETIPKGKERILLVDDEEQIVRLIQKMLERLDYQVTMRTSSIETLEAFRAKPNEFDLVITDLTMPNMTGDKLAKELMKIRSDIPVILCTGFSEKMSHEKANALNIKGFLMKPIVKIDLAKTVREVLDKK
jgi:PAS domain S-box-containing protein